MGSIYGDSLKVSIFGESHGPAIGAVIDNFPPGVAVDLDFLEEEMKRRSASGNPLATPRKEADKVKILSGVFDGYTEGTPICGLILNSKTRSSDYANLKDHPRPGHADYTAGIRYRGFQDYRGGGHFSGRLTAPLVFAGALAKMALKKFFPQITIGSRIVSIGSAVDETVIQEYESLHFEDTRFPTVDPAAADAMKEEVIEAIREKDSVGGIIEGYVTGMPRGVGDPIFGSIESRLSSMLFSIPAVKGVSFGSGFEIAGMRGSEANDPFTIENGTIYTTSNHNGGINGGISNGMPIVFRCAFKPTASIAKEQRSVKLSEGREESLVIEGRHDPCIVVRACPVVEACAAFTVLDLLMSSQLTTL